METVNKHVYKQQEQGNWNSRKTGVGLEGELAKSLLFIGFFTSEVHRTA